MIPQKIEIVDGGKDTPQSPLTVVELPEGLQITAGSIPRAGKQGRNG